MKTLKRGDSLVLSSINFLRYNVQLGVKFRSALAFTRLAGTTFAAVARAAAASLGDGYVDGRNHEIGRAHV